jgi:capsular polysaccharide biosynthesis protein
MRLAAKLYPRAWRERYSEEFDALLDDYQPSWRELGDVMRGAVKMQIRTGSDYLKIVGALAVAGALVAVAASFVTPRKYVSSAVVQMAPQGIELEQAYLSRTFLTTLVYDSRLGLYPEKGRMPLEDTINKMRRDLRVSRVEAHVLGGATEPALDISFAYPDKAKARAVVARLVSEAVDRSATINAERALFWQELWPHDPPPASLHQVQILSPASVPGKPSAPNRLAFMAVGMGAGLLLGLLVAFVVRQPKRTLLLAGFALGGAAVAIAVAFVIPDTYTSTATVRLEPPMFPERPSGAALAATMGERFRRVQQEVFSQASLAEIVQDTSLDLYKSDRARKPLEKVVETIRTRDLAIHPLNSAATSPDSAPGISISFSYPDKQKAQRVVQEILTRLVNSYVQDSVRIAKDMKPGDETAQVVERHFGDQFEVLDPASYPSIPVAPNRMIFLAVGMGCGLSIGLLTLRLRQRGRQMRTA